MPTFRSLARVETVISRISVIGLTLALLGGSVGARAQSGVVVVSTSTTWASGTYNLTSLTVQGGATLTLGGGSTVTVSGAVLVTGNSNIVFASINTTAMVGGAWAGAGSTMNADSVEVDAGSTINADGQGYVAGAGPGAGASGTTNGGSNCGLGGGQPSNSGVSCNVRDPTSIGSGGGQAGGVGGAGGGAIYLNVTNALELYGRISANGGAATGAAGGGAGGSVFLVENALMGLVTTGTTTSVVQAIGGSNTTGNGSGGGGGDFTAAAPNYEGVLSASAVGGTGTVGNSAGGVGDYLYEDLIYSDPMEIEKDSSLAGNILLATGLNVDATLTLAGGTVLTVNNDVTVTGHIVMQSVNNTVPGVGVTLNAFNLTLAAGGSINADGQGYGPQAGPGAGSNTTGGSYGGAGGGNSSALYGSASAPVDLGSGGGTYQSIGGYGGGAVTVNVTAELTNNGIISAEGQTFTVCTGSGACGDGFAGGGSGGSVNVTAGTLTGTGTFNADGGPNASGNGGGGGGGRVAVTYGTNAGFTNFTTSTANGGTVGSGGTPGQPGTVGFFNTTTGGPSGLTVYSNFTLPAGTNVTYSSLTVQNGATLTIGGGSSVTVAGELLVTGNSNMILQSANNTAQVTGTWQGAGVTLNAGSVEVDAGSSINADGQGYAAKAGPGAGTSGTGNGGSYGGAGGGQLATTTYGSATAPSDLGSGGAQYQATAGAGGGAIMLAVTGTLTNNGIISANGASESGNGFAGGGSGGSVYVTTATLAGAGSFQANGGPNPTQYGNGGGGGRIAIYSGSATSFTGFATSTATGGSIGTGGSASPGANGTVAFFDTSVPNSNVSVYQNYTIPASTNIQYNSFTLAPGATMTIGGGSQLVIQQALHISGTVTAQSVSNSTMVDGQWQGRGVKIIAGTAQIDAAGSITADGLGYPAKTGLGAGTAGTGNGGSYGGIGGGQAKSTTYGSATQPIDLGSGGAEYQGTSGAGGGAIELLVSGTLTENGSISANGQTIGGFVGAGSGGSVYVAANTLTGAGTIAANGGSNTSTYGDGGGGGRVAVYYLTNAGFPSSSITANGGTVAAGGDVAGAIGTITYSNTAVSEWILPTEPVIHGTSAALSWFTDNGGATTVRLEGPQTKIIAQGTSAFSSTTLDTTSFPDGAYELRLLVLDGSGNTVEEVPQPEVINNSVVWHTGTLTANEEWSPTQGVHALDGIVTVPAGITLTIDPGTIVKALPGAEILVLPGGTLNAQGTQSSQVVFTTFDDSSIGGDTDFNQGISLPTPGEWDGIEVLGTGTFDSNSNTIVRYAQTLLFGTLAGNTTLLPFQVYEVSGTLVVPSGITLSILPGAIVKFDLGAGIDAQPGSTLTANGTLAEPIYFTSIRDDSIGGNTNTSGDTSAPEAGDWNSIEIDGATASFNFAQLQYGGGPLNSSAQAGMIETGNKAVVTLANSILAYSYFIGLQTGYPNGSNDTVTVTNTTFYAIEDRAINTFTSTVHVVNDTFDSNAAGVYVHGGTVDIANSVVTGSNSTQFGGIGTCCGGTLTSIVNTDVYTTVSGVPNYVGYTDPTGTNGNISASPVYMNGPQHDYRPTYGSPLIDAANGTVANYPTTDAYNDPRYNDPLVTPKTGTPDANGNYPDIGAFEFVQTAPSDIDFTVDNVQGPSSAMVGTQVQVSWTVTNIGMGTAYGPWHDSVYLVSDPGTNPQPVLGGAFLEGTGAVLGPGGSYNATATVTVPGTIVGPHRWEVKTNVRGEVFEGANTANNTANSINPVAIDLTPLVVGAGALSGSFSGTGASSYYKISPTDGQATSIQLALPSGVAGSVQLFIGGGYVPSPQQFDYQQIEFDSPTASVVIPSGGAQTYYITAYAQSLPASQEIFTIQAQTAQFSLTSVSPTSIYNGGSQTLTYVGGGFTANTLFRLVSSAGVSYIPSSVFIDDSDHADVTYDLTTAAIGTYSPSASNGTPITLTNAVTLGNLPGYGLPVGEDGSLQVWLDTPAAFRAGFPAQVTLHYANIGDRDLVAPLIYIGGTNVTLSEIAPPCSDCSPNYQQQYAYTYNSGLVLGTSNSGPAGILPAGDSGSISFLATPYKGSTVSQFYTTTTGAELIGTQLISVYYTCPAQEPDPCIFQPQQTGSYASSADFCSSITPPGASVAGNTRACMLMMNNAGYSDSTSYQGFVTNIGINGPYTDGGLYIGAHLPYAGFNQLLASDATALSVSGNNEYDSQRLLTYEMQKDGLYQFLSRYHQGAFGYGPSEPFDITAAMTSGTPIIYMPNGIARRFPSVSPTQANVYLGTTGDYGTITVNSDSSLTLTELDGHLYHFAVNGSGYQFDYLQDRNGNRATITYTNSLVTNVADNFGHALAFQYDSLGHITQITDNDGRVTSLTYDTLNDTLHSTFLTSISNAAGTTTLKWNEGGSNGVGYIDDTCIATYCDPAIGVTNVTFPDGSQENFTYDAVGRLTSQSAAGNTQATSYSYGPDGTLVVTDALGNSTQYTMNYNGYPTAITDALGNVTSLQYDGEGKLTRQIGQLGDSFSIFYDNNNDVNGFLQPSGNYTSVAYTGDQSGTSLTDSAGNLYGFGYDLNFNRTSLTDPAGAAITYTIDPSGNVLTRTNRRGQTTTYTYNSFGLLATQQLSTGALTTYSYNNHQKLQTVTSSAGTISYTYNPADQLTSVTNPDGTTLNYTYNSQDQRSSLTDSTGFTLNYTYDTDGRLSTLANGPGTTLVTYAYDPNGRVSTRTFANGTTTTYTYDANGNILSVVHRSATAATLGAYDYTYDAEGNPVTEQTPSGTLSYGYDLDGQLTSVTSPGATIQYTYDNAGNRTTVVNNNTTAAYLPNNLNQYTQANGSVYNYDVDGNLIAGNGVTYTYNEMNQLLTQVSATDSWSYQYDGIGNRIAFTHNGVTTRLLNDPLGQGNVLAELSSSGALQAHYIYGDVLIGSMQSSGALSFYHFDATGNTTQVTNASGAIADSYSYLPFGEKTTLTSSVYNPFTYVGAFGVRDEGSGLYTMDERTYNPALGRFQQQDPLDFGGGDTNLYRYANNSPVLFVDPQGLNYYQDTYANSSDKLNSATNTGNSALNYASPFLGSGVAAGAGNIYSAVNTGISLAQNIQKGNTSGTIHDLTMSGLTMAAMYLNANPEVQTGLAETGVGAAVVVLVQGAGFIDQISQDAFGGWEEAAYQNTDNPFGSRQPSPSELCGPCVTKKRPSQSVPNNGAIDPNGKLTSGYGDNGYVPLNAPINYTVYFENLSTATAPAQIVTVTDQLASNLDWTTVQLQQIAFNTTTVNVPSGTQTFSTQSSVTTDPNPVNVSASLNPATGLLTWTMQSVDPVTGSYPANPLAGFLPPNDASNSGVGSVTFSVTPKSGLANAAAITNQASIIFDVNAAILTNTVTNTLDVSSPTSAVNSLPSTTQGSSVNVSWSGSDPSGAGIASYNIYVSVDGGTYSLWLSATTLTSSVYSAITGHTYSFVSLATNNVGITQNTPTTPATTSVTSITPTVTVTPATSNIAPTATLMVGISITSSSTTMPTGSVVLTSGSYTSAAVTLVSGSASVLIPAGALATGVDTLAVTYTPDASGYNNFTTATGTALVTVGGTSVQVMVGASPSGETFSVDGTNYTTTQSFTWTIGSSHTLATTSPQTNGGTQETFSTWTDGGAISHSVTASVGTTAYAASFTTAYLLTTAASPTAGGSVTPASGTYYTAGTVVPLVATPSSGYSFNGWTGTVANSSSASTTVIMNSAQNVTANFTLIPVPVTTFSLSSLTFTAVSGTPSAAQTLTLTNTGTAPLTLNSITIGGVTPAVFAQTNTCGITAGGSSVTLAPNSHCTISVTFTASALGTFTASLSIADNAAGSPQSVSLTGTGAATTTFTLTASPTTQIVNAHSQATVTVTLTPQGGAFNSAIALSTAGQLPGEEVVFSPASVTPGAQPATSTLTISNLTALADPSPVWPRTTPVLALFGILLLATRRRRHWLARCCLGLLLSIAAMTSLIGCGSNLATSTITITATSGSIVQSTSVSLVVK